MIKPLSGSIEFNEGNILPDPMKGNVAKREHELNMNKKAAYGCKRMQL